MALTIKQEKFCQLYAQTGNGTQSYIQAGFKAKTDAVAGVLCTRLLKKDSIKNRIKELQEKSETAAILTLEQIKERLTQIALQGLTEETIVVEGIGEGCSQARIMNKKASIRDATKALELLAKMKGAFDGQNQIPIIPVIIKGEDLIKD